MPDGDDPQLASDAMGRGDWRLGSRGWVWLESLGALALTIVFYGLGLALALGLLAGPVYLALTYRQPAGLLLGFSAPAALVVLRAILPGRSVGAEEPPPVGPCVGREAQPRLWQVVDEVADAMGERPPDELFLTLAPLARVGEPSSPAHSERRRVMELGVPVLAGVDEAGLRSILAHELGHYAGGDTRPGAVLLHAHDAIGRALDRLAERPAPLRAPFAWYAAVFFRLTQGAARRREVRADALAIRLFGPRAHDEGLAGEVRAQLAIEPYWERWVEPVLEAGYRPPLLEGFDRFLRAANAREALDEAVRITLAEEQAGPYASHPGLRERLASRGDSEAAIEWVPSPPVTALLADTEALEVALLEVAGGQELARALRPVAWDEVGARALLPGWRERPPEDLSLAEETVADLPIVLAQVRARREHDGHPASNDEDAREREVEDLGRVVAVALGADGLAPVASPGEVLRMESAGRSFAPFASAARLVYGEISAGEWRDLVAAVGVSNVRLAPPEGGPAEAPDGRNEHAQPPAPVHAVLPLAPEWSARALTVAGLLIVALIGLPIAVLFIFIAFAPGTPPGGRVFAVAVGTALVAVLGWFAWSRSRLAFRPARLALEGDRVRIDHRGVFDAPMTIDRGGLRLVALDTEHPETAGTDADRRFPISVGGSRWAAPGSDLRAPWGWLWTAVGGSPLPYIGVTARRPNLAVLLAEPLAAPNLRRETTFGPLRGEAVVGLLMTVRDPGSARRALKEWDVLREVGIEDAEAVEAGLLGESAREREPVALAAV